MFENERVAVDVLGPIQVRITTRSAPVSLSATHRRLIGILAADPGVVVTVDRLLDGLGVSKTALHTAVSRLRSTIGPDAVVTVAAGYTLGDVDVDAARFCDLLSSAAATRGDERAERLREALALWRGVPFAEFAHDEWAVSASVRLDELHASAVEEHADCLLAVGRSVDAVAAILQHIESHPLRDRPRAILMSALAAQGRITEARRVAHRYREYLATNVGTEPTAAFQQLERSLAAGQAENDEEADRENRGPVTNIGPDRSAADDVDELARRGAHWTDWNKRRGPA